VKVHVRGSLPCDVLFVGEGPGKTEDMLGIPFVGRAGKLLDLILPDINKGLARQWAIVNLVACRPTEGVGRANRKPTDEEIANCEDHLTALVELAQPKAIVLLGREAQVGFPVHLAKRCPILHAYHPAYICRKGGERAEEFEPWKASILQFIREQT
jgi:DNA polymerase